MKQRAVTQALAIPGPVGPLEALLEEPAAGHIGHAVLCHPHPLQGGTLHNKVVHTLARALQELGFATLRFNYRGVGASAGSYGDSIGETADTLAVTAWAAARYGASPLVLGGFSFGGAVAFGASQALAPVALITVAPAIDRVAVASATRPNCQWLIVQGEADDVVASERVQAWASGFNPPPELRLLPGVGHFFHGALNELRVAVQSFATPLLPDQSQVKKSPVP
jgi:alpha/beta superfamily hydrolase